MKTATIPSTLVLLALLGIASPAWGQSPINVHISPDANSTLIGKLPSLSLAVNAEWPKNTEPTPGWRPIYYRGEFLVYLDSQDIGKDFAPLPGARYLLSPSPDADTLAIATEEDKAEIVSIDPRYCHINLETIVLGYIQDNASPPPSSPTRPSAQSRIEPKQPKLIDDSSKALEGILVSANSFEFTHSGYRFKLVNSDNETIAYLDPSKLQAAEPFNSFLNTRLTAWGTIDDTEKADAVVLRAKILKKKN